MWFVEAAAVCGGILVGVAILLCRGAAKWEAASLEAIRMAEWKARKRKHECNVDELHPKLEIDRS